MLPDGTYTGVVDRFEEDADETELAVILLEEDDEVVEQVDIPRADLHSAVDQDAILVVTLEDGEVTNVEFEPEETKVRAEEAQSRFDQLARRPPNSSDGGKNNSE